MRRTAAAMAVLGGALALAGCGPRPLDADEQVARAVLGVLVADGKPVCVQRITYGDPLTVYRSARRGELQRFYPMDWYPPVPFRPPLMPTQAELRRAVAEGRDAELPDAPVRLDALPRDQRSQIDAVAFALSSSAVPTHSTLVRTAWTPPRAHPRWWPGKDAALGCEANYVLSSVKRSDHAAFMAVRVDHWATLYALAPAGSDWKVVAQWANWLY